MLKDFIEFLKLYGIVGLAIAVIIGGKLNTLVSAVVNDFVTPLILMPALEAANVNDIGQLHINGIKYGNVLGAVLDFLVVALIVFLFAKYVLKEEKVTKK